MNSITFFINQALAFLISLQGMLAIVVGVIVCAVVYSKPKAKWLAFSLLLFAALVSPAIGGWRVYEVEQYLHPLFAKMQNLSRLLCLFWLIVLTVGLFVQVPSWRRQIVGTGTAVFFLAHFTLAIRLLFTDVAQRGVVSIPLLILLGLVFVAGLGRWLQGPQDVRKILLAVVAAGAMFVLCSFFQYVLEPNSVKWRGRFYGIGSNPQQVGLVMASVVTIAIYFVTRRDENKYIRLAMIGLIPFMLASTIWTGSRLSLLAVATGAVLMLYNKLGKAIFLLPLLILLLIAVESFIGIDLEVKERITSTENTRTHVWANQIDEFKESPFFGQVVDRWKPGESSWLGMARVAGMLGLLPLTIAVILMIKETFVVWRQRYLLGAEAPTVDVVIALFGLLMLYSIGEAYMLMPLSLGFMFLLINLAVLRLLREMQENSNMSIHDANALYPQMRG
ncbi:MAG: hypothetical protein AAF911_02350 [Planctomycetota bacterium]